MDKLTRYNQRILAVGGTLLLLVALFSCLFMGYELYDQWWRRGNRETDTRMIANREAEELKADSLRKQVVSFNQVVLVDTPGLKYLIPVGQATLEHAEAYGLDLSNRKSHYSDDGGNARTFNNLLLYDGKSGKVEKIFSKRLSINHFEIAFEALHQPVVFMDVTEDDSNKDGFFDSRDMEKLFFYRIHDRLLFEVDAPGKKFLQIILHKSPDEALVQYGVDKDHDGVFEESFEPKVFYRLNLADGKPDEIISQQLIDELQRQLEGK